MYVRLQKHANERKVHTNGIIYVGYHSYWALLTQVFVLLWYLWYVYDTVCMNFTFVCMFLETNVHRVRLFANKLKLIILVSVYLQIN